MNRSLGGPCSLSERFKVEKTLYARIQTPNCQVRSVTTLPNATAECMHTVLRGSGPFYPVAIQNCPLTTPKERQSPSSDFCVCFGVLYVAVIPPARKLLVWEVTFENGCATVGHSLGTGKAFSAPVLRSFRRGGRVYGTESK